MTNELTTSKGKALATNGLADIGKIANGVAAAHAFADYRARKAANTLRRQDADLALFADYLGEVGGEAGDLAHDPTAWHGLTWGLVAGFVQWQLQRGYAVSTTNVRLSTVKAYAKLAAKAGSLDKTEFQMIRTVEGHSRKEGKRVDEARTAADVPTRTGSKKAEPVSLTRSQAKDLKAQPGDTGQGRRDALHARQRWRSGDAPLG